MSGAVAGEIVGATGLTEQHGVTLAERRGPSTHAWEGADQARTAGQGDTIRQPRREPALSRKYALLQNQVRSAASRQPAVAGLTDGRSSLEFEGGPNGIVPAQQLQREWQLSQGAGEEQPIGKAPPVMERGPPEILAIPDLGGVLTPRGKLILEPSFQFSNSQVNRFTFRGVEILDTFLIGILEAEDADRDLISLALTVRYGINNRLELEVKVPYIDRDDELSTTIVQATGEAKLTRDLEGSGMGDVEFALHYQINRGRQGHPFFVGNVRYKSDTGEGPFDVDRDVGGIETELATGSGFQAIEPSLTVLYATDPAVLFGNVGYLFHLKDDVDKTFGGQTVGEVDPGDAFRISFGMGYAINVATSFTLGYKHDFIQKTETEINGVDLSSSSLDVGALLLGFSYQIKDGVGWNLNLELGATDDAPDVVLTFRVPIVYDLARSRRKG